jgi:hypothetical protein
MNKGGLEVIPDFKIKYPEYAVVTPHTNKEYTVRSLKISEEEALRSSLLTPASLTQHLNKVIYNSIVNKPESITNISDFLKSTTMADRDALMYALYHVTYKDEHNYDVNCAECDHVNSVKIKFGDSFSMVAWNGEESILDKEVKAKLKMADQLTIVIKQPTLLDEQNLMEKLKFATEEEREKQLGLLPIHSIEIDMGQQTSGTNIDIISDRDNIKAIYSDIPAQDRNIIEKEYLDNFGKYGVSLKTIVVCEKCQHKNETELDLVRQFFRAVYE